MSALESLDARRLGASYFRDSLESLLRSLYPPSVAADTPETRDDESEALPSALPPSSSSSRPLATGSAAAPSSQASELQPGADSDVSASQPGASEFSRLGAALRSLATLRIGESPADPRLSFSEFTRLHTFSATSLYVHHLAQLPASLTSLRVSDAFLATATDAVASDDEAVLALALLAERARGLADLRVPTVPIIAALLDDSRLRLGERLQRLECGRDRYTRTRDGVSESMARAGVLLPDARRLTVHDITDRPW